LSFKYICLDVPRNTKLLPVHKPSPIVSCLLVQHSTLSTPICLSYHCLPGSSSVLCLALTQYFIATLRIFPLTLSCPFHCTSRDSEHFLAKFCLYPLHYFPPPPLSSLDLSPICYPGFTYHPVNLL